MTHQLQLITSNTLAQLTAKFVGAGLTLITTYLTIRLAGLDLYGDLTKILVMVAIGFTVIDFGLNAAALRNIKSKTDTTTTTWVVIKTRLILALLAILVLNLVVYFLPGGYSATVKNLFWLGSLAIIFQGIYTSGNTYFQYHLNYWKSTLSVVAGSVTATLLTLYFLFTSPTLFSLILANTLGYLVMAVVTLLLLPRTTRPPHSLSPVFVLLRSAAPLGLILVTSVIASKIDTVLLGIFQSSNEVGQYGFAYRIFEVILVLPVFAMNTIYPLMLKSKQALLRPAMLSLGVLGVITALAAYLFAPWILLIKPGLDLAVSSFRMLSLSLPLFYLTAPLMWHLIANQRDRQVLATYSLAAALNFILNYLNIPRYGALAAAITTGFTELFIFVLLLYFSIRLPSSRA